MKSIFICSLIGASLLAVAQIPPDAENPGSLFPNKYSNPFLDRTARSEGDLLTILISESSTATFAAATTASKTDDNKITELLGPTIFKRIFPNLGSSAESKTGGNGNTTQSGRMTARMTAIVKQVLPNGNLVIEGFRSVKVNHETQLFFLTGIIRRDDVRSDNSVLSESIANAEIRLDGKGQISERTRKGLLTKILDWLF